MASLKTYLSDLVNLVYPQICYACTENQRVKDGLFCIQCLIDLPESDMYKNKDNYLTEKLWGQLRFETGAGLFLFEQGSPIQKMIHRIKYNNRPDIAMKMGRYLGTKLMDQDLYQNIDTIIPVPLHPKRRNKRGYNQSEKFAAGISEVMGKPIDVKNLSRIRDTSTQTKKGKRERIDNVKGAFKLNNPDHFSGRAILLVDDVITTGATIGACAELFTGSKIYMATLGVAIN